MKKFSLVIWISLIITFSLWILSKDSIATILDFPIKSLAQITALVGAVAFFTSFILSSRFPFFEKELALDKAYTMHRLIGTLAGSGILLHVGSLISNLLPSKFALSLYLIPGTNLSYTLGTLAFYLMMIMILSSIYLKLPYPIWKLIHKISSYSIIIATLHIFLISSDVSNYLPLRIWILSIAFLSLIAWFYRQFIYKKQAFTHEYKVVDVLSLQSITVFTLENTINPIKFEPGQFAFFKIIDESKQITTESHPFTILSSSASKIMIAAKELGDYTTTLKNLKIGTTVTVAGPHGSFGKQLLESKRPTIWIAGGIGITPFFNIMTYLASEPEIKVPSTLYYTNSEQDSIFHPQLLGYAQKLSIPYTFINSSVEGHLTPEVILKPLTEKPAGYEFFLCGPDALITAITNALLQAGVPETQIHTEDFDFRALEV